MISYAQNFEDVLLARAFRHRKTGFYVDIGAYHPTRLSVTKHFYDKGWTGINIDPVEANIRMFDRLRPKDRNIRSLVGSKRAVAHLVNPGALALARLDAQGRERDSDIEAGRETAVPVATFQEIYRRFNQQNIDFMNIDVMGWADILSKESGGITGNMVGGVLRGIGLSNLRPVVIIVKIAAPSMGSLLGEHREAAAAQGLRKVWEPLLLDAGYAFAYTDGLSCFYVRSEDRQVAQCFAVPVGPAYDCFEVRGDISVTSKRIRQVVDNSASKRHAAEDSGPIAHPGATPPARVEGRALRSTGAGDQIESRWAAHSRPCQKCEQTQARSDALREKLALTAAELAVSKERIETRRLFQERAEAETVQLRQAREETISRLAESQVMVAELQHFKFELEHRNAEIQRETARLQRLSDERDVLRHELDVARQELARSVIEHTATRERSGFLAEARAQLEREIGALSQVRDHAMARLSESEHELARLRPLASALSETRAQLEAAHREVARLTQERSEFEGKLAQSNDASSQLERETGELREMRTQALERLEAAEARNAEQEKAEKELRKQLEDRDQALGELRRANEVMARQLKESQGRSEMLALENSDFAERLVSGDGAMQGKEIELERLRGDCEQLKKQLESSRTERSRAEKELERLAARHSEQTAELQASLREAQRQRSLRADSQQSVAAQKAAAKSLKVKASSLDAELRKVRRKLEIAIAERSRAGTAGHAAQTSAAELRALKGEIERLCAENAKLGEHLSGETQRANALLEREAVLVAMRDAGNAKVGELQQALADLRSEVARAIKNQQSAEEALRTLRLTLVAKDKLVFDAQHGQRTLWNGKLLRNGH